MNIIGQHRKFSHYLWCACNINVHRGKSSVKALVNKPPLKIAGNTLVLLTM